MNKYPQNSDELKWYLEKYPLVKVKGTNWETTYRYRFLKNLRLVFSILVTNDFISFPIGIANNHIEYHSDGFIRKIGTNIISWFYYMGHKPWKEELSESEKRIEDWNSVLKEFRRVIQCKN